LELTEEQPLSKTKLKRQQRLEENQAFLKARKIQQFVFFDKMLAEAKQVYEANKHELSEDDQRLIEAKILEDEKLLEDYRANLGLQDLHLPHVDSVDSGTTGQGGDDGQTSSSDLG
jgi:hypothetical protein